MGSYLIISMKYYNMYIDLQGKLFWTSLQLSFVGILSHEDLPLCEWVSHQPCHKIIIIVGIRNVFFDWYMHINASCVCVCASANFWKHPKCRESECMYMSSMRWHFIKTPKNWENIIQSYFPSFLAIFHFKAHDTRELARRLIFGPTFASESHPVFFRCLGEDRLHNCHVLYGGILIYTFIYVRARTHTHTIDENWAIVMTGWSCENRIYMQRSWLSIE